MKKTCLNCGKVFEAARGTQKHCCRYCRCRYKRHKMSESEWREIVDRDVFCSFCGKPIIGRKNLSPKSTIVFCDDKCANRFMKHGRRSLPESGVRICENCGREYYYEKGQMNWGKNGLKDGGGGIRSDLYCCWKCGQEVINRRKAETCEKHYGVSSPLKNKSIQEKASRTYQEKTGYINPSQNPKVQNKKEETCLRNFGVRKPAESEEIRKKQKQSLIKSLGCENPSQSEEVKIKKRQTMKRNNSFNRSKEEDRIGRLLEDRYKDIKRQYASKLYPFSCDFYIPELDLYIEYQGFWSHGKEPYKKDKKEHQRILEQWKNNPRPQYKSAIETWTVKDPLKRKTAIKNKLNWIEFFTFEEFMEWYSNN